MELKLEEYINERIKIFDSEDACSSKEQYIDAETGKIIDHYITDYSKVEDLINGLDKKYCDAYNDEYLLYKTHEKSKWSVYKIDSIELQDFHMGKILVQQVGKNFRKNKYKYLYFRRGIIKSTTKDEIMNMFEWHETNNYEYDDKYLYIFKNELGRIKIGQAINVKNRATSIEMSSGVKITILNMIKNSAKYEKKLHKYFDKYKHMGEWFKLEKKYIKWLCSLNEINIEIEINYLLSNDIIS
jgi:hypothetical protein